LMVAVDVVGVLEKVFSIPCIGSYFGANRTAIAMLKGPCHLMSAYVARHNPLENNIPLSNSAIIITLANNI
jgi:hypothetical protein